MNRWHALAAGITAALGVVFVSGASVPTEDEKPADEKKANPAKPRVVIGQKTGYFNMAAVMRDFGQAKYQVWLLNKKKIDLSRNMIDQRGEYIKLQTGLRNQPNHPNKDEMARQMLGLARQIEDEDRKISKQLNDDSSTIIGELYDKIKAVVDKTAELNGYQAVLAYPDAVTDAERQSPYIKELKLKPPAAQPFYVDPQVDITAAVVKTLNTWYPPVDPQTGQPVDVSKLEMPLPVPMPPPPPGPAPLPELPPGGVPMGGVPRPGP